MFIVFSTVQIVQDKPNHLQRITITNPVAFQFQVEFYCSVLHTLLWSSSTGYFSRPSQTYLFTLTYLHLYHLLHHVREPVKFPFIYFTVTPTSITALSSEAVVLSETGKTDRRYICFARARNIRNLVEEKSCTMITKKYTRRRHTCFYFIPLLQPTVNPSPCANSRIFYGLSITLHCICSKRN